MSQKIVFLLLVVWFCKVRQSNPRFQAWRIFRDETWCTNSKWGSKLRKKTNFKSENHADKRLPIDKERIKKNKIKGTGHCRENLANINVTNQKQLIKKINSHTKRQTSVLNYRWWKHLASAFNLVDCLSKWWHKAVVNSDLPKEGRGNKNVSCEIWTWE